MYVCLCVCVCVFVCVCVCVMCVCGCVRVTLQEGLAPLHVAVKEKHEEVCRAILNFRGQVDIEDNNLR